jgi:hypothetical protein
LFLSILQQTLLFNYKPKIEWQYLFLKLFSILERKEIFMEEIKMEKIGEKEWYLLAPLHCVVVLPI